jgi:nucleoid-associated protein YgaU
MTGRVVSARTDWNGLHMNKNTPKFIFTGLAVVAAGVLAAVGTGTVPMGLLTPPGGQPQASAPAGEAQPAQPKVEQSQNITQGQTEQNAAPAVSDQAPAVQPAAPAAEQQTAVANPQDGQSAEGTNAAAPAAAETPAAPAGKIQDRFPSFDTVRVETTGDAVIAGHAAPGSEVTIKFAGEAIGKATANAEGSFVFVPDKPLKAGAGALTLESSVDGQTVTSQDQVAVVVQVQQPAIVAKVEPQQPTQIVQSDAAGAAPKQVEISAVDYDDQGNIIFQGRVPADSAVRFYVDNAAIGDAKPDATGHWLFKGQSPIAAGTHTLRADEIDAAGKVVSRAETPFLREAPEKVIAAAGQDAGTAPAAAPAAEQQASADPAAAPQPAAPAAAEAAASAAVVSATTADGPTRIVIQPGNNLWRISREVYGKGKLYTVIWQANRNQIKNPNRVYPGQILAAPKS